MVDYVFYIDSPYITVVSCPNDDGPSGARLRTEAGAPV